MTKWLDFWNGTHRIYVNDRHLQAHYHRVAADILGLLPNPAMDLLDWGCGPALGAGLLADGGVRVTLYDRAATSAAQARRRYAGDPRVKVLTDAEFIQLRVGSFDVIVVNSVLQYLTGEETRALVPIFRHLLRPGGRLILADIITPGPSMAADVRALLWSGLRHGYFCAALASLGQTFFSDYRKLRKNLGLTTYRPEAVLALLQEFGFTARELPRNIGFSGHRKAFEAVVPVRGAEVAERSGLRGSVGSQSRGLGGVR